MAAKKRKQKIKKPEKVSRAKYQCPPELLKLIDTVNLLPPEANLDSLDFVINEMQNVLRERTGEPNPYVDLEKAVEFCLADLPETIKSHIDRVAFVRGTPPGEIRLFMSSLSRGAALANAYTDFYNLCFSMRQLVYHLGIIRERKEQNPHDCFHGFLPLTLQTTIEQDDEGKLHVAGLSGLIGKFDENRLRKCKICNRIFWAKREDSQTCSAPCLNNLRVRRFRQLSDEERATKKAQREANQQQNKKLKKIRESKNGTL